MIPLQFGNRRFEFPFLLAAVDRPILGADFLAEFNLLVESAKCQVLQRSSIEPLAPLVISTTGTAIASVFKLASDVSSLLDKFPLPGNHAFLVNCQDIRLNM